MNRSCQDRRAALKLASLTEQMKNAAVAVFPSDGPSTLDAMTAYQL